ncbi:NAD(P)-dependent oxidoreductase [Nocardioides sp. TRM66260-LWL]|uniref:NAD(P)-dependent oxidoreductase n=1 Tax=Nocardioides sp. TRM66260-LWL TaxID=2874478 RepID=UPI001CC7DAC0|nr:NAD(P)-dependent oxidoreductase [Nocardioides sp. TRM66260-LWL]MBZ5735504.1 NAD(P)-dependent oxidoreductase [Nocardioides sp. TRM66260-LWL]
MSETTPTVAVLGTGIMGAAMARSLCRADLPVRVWNRTPSGAEPLAEAGARVCASVEEAVSGADVVVTMLHDGAAVRDVLAQAGPATAPGARWLQCTTVGPDELPGLADIAASHDLVLYDAPVLGTREPAEAGNLVVLAAGPEQGRDALAPVLDAVGARTQWVGDDAASAAATRLKLVANSWVLAINNAAGETVAVAEALGVEPSAFLEAIGGGPLDLPYLRAKTALILEDRTEEASFGVDTAAKDARLIVAAAEAGGRRVDGLAAARDRLQRASEAGLGAHDMAAAHAASSPQGA